MKRAPNSISLSILIAGLLGGTAMVTPTAVRAATADLQAQTSWAITRVASMTQGAYCTMAQKFSNDAIVTLARNNDGEYSLAFDFQTAKFEADKEIPVSIKAGGGSSQTFAVKPPSPSVVVIGLGKDDGFVSDVKSSGRIMLDAAGSSYVFNTAKFGEAQDEMTACMSALKPALREAKNEAAVKADAPVAAAATKTAPNSIKPSAEALTSAPVTMAASVVSPETADPTKLADENARLKRALEESRRSYENQMTAQSGAIVPELQEKIRTLDMENARLKEQIAQTGAPAVAASGKPEMSRLAAELDKTRKDLAAATAQNQSLQNQLQLAGKEPAKTEPAACAPAAGAGEIAALRAENERLTKDLTARDAKSSSLPAEAQQRLSDLQTENAALKTQLAQARSEAAKPAPVLSANSEEENKLRDQLRDVQSQLDLVQSENDGLKKQLETVQRSAETSQLKAAGGNWDLEQATRRYQESQREIRRLGALLEEDRSKCKQEKKDIEYMLFDPEVAQPAQIAKLGSLEDQIAEKDARIAELEAALKSGAPASSRVAVQPPVGKSETMLAEAKPFEPAAAKPVEAKDDLPLPDRKAEKAPATAKEAPVKEAVPFPLQEEPGTDMRKPAPVQEPLKPAEMKPAETKVSVMETAPVAPAVVTPAPVITQPVHFRTSEDFAVLLRQAGVTVLSPIKAVQNASSGNFRAYSWKTDKLFGAAEQRQMMSEAGFDAAVQQYVDRAKSRCKGEFSATSAQIQAKLPAKGYEISCMKGQGGSSASVLFTYKDGLMTTVAHEGRADAMSAAVDVRNRVASKITTN